MDRQDVNRTAKAIRALVKGKRYSEAIALAENLNLDKINNGILILDIVEAYEKLGDKKSAKNTLLAYYDTYGITGRNMMQKLVELCIETKDIENAVGLCMQFENEWPNSSISYLMRYQITASAGGSFSEQIHYLEKYHEVELDERWGYELARLYYRNNQRDKCARICHDIICYFGHGAYVDKAVSLKERAGGLTADEKEIIRLAAIREEEARRLREEEQLRLQEEQIRFQEEQDALEEQIRLQEEQKALEEQIRLQEEQKALEEQIRLQEEQDALEEQIRFQNEEPLMAATQKEQALGRVYQDSDLQDTEGEEIEQDQLVRNAETDKIRQTEEAAKQRREKQIADQMNRQKKIDRALTPQDHYMEVENRKADSIYFSDFPRRVISGKKTEKGRREGGMLGRITAGLKKSIKTDSIYTKVLNAGMKQEESVPEEEIILPVGDMESYMRKELELLNDEQVENLTAEQLKEIYELKILRSLRAVIKQQVEKNSRVYGLKMNAAALDQFAKNDPFMAIVPVQEEESAFVTVMDGMIAQEPDFKDGEGHLPEASAETLEKRYQNSKSAADVTPDIWKKTEKKAETGHFVTDTSPKEIRHIVAGGKMQAFTADTKETLSDEERIPSSKTAPEALESAGGSDSDAKKAEKEADIPAKNSSKGENRLYEFIKHKVVFSDMQIRSALQNHQTSEGAEKTAVDSAGENDSVDKSTHEPEISKSAMPDQKSDAQSADNDETEGFQKDETGEAVNKMLKETLEKQMDEAVLDKQESVEKTVSRKTQDKQAETDSSIPVQDGFDKKNSNAETDALSGHGTDGKIIEKQTSGHVLSEEDFLQYVIKYAEEKGFYVDEGAYMTIRILEDEMRKKNVLLTAENASVMTDQAIKRLQKRNPLDRFMDKYNKKNSITLRDKHFDWK